MKKPLPRPHLERRALLRALALALATAAIANCDNLDNFDVDVDATAKIPAGTVLDELLGVLDFQSFNSIDLTQELDNQGVTKEDVDSVVMTSFTLTIQGPAGANFDFLESVSFFAETEGQPKVLVAKLDPVPKGATTLELEMTGVELKPYVVAPKMRISAAVAGKRPMQETTVLAAVVLDVDVTVPGC
jgi:hypothetical protein